MKTIRKPPKRFFPSCILKIGGLAFFTRVRLSRSPAGQAIPQTDSTLRARLLSDQPSAAPRLFDNCIKSTGRRRRTVIASRVGRSAGLGRSTTLGPLSEVATCNKLLPLRSLCRCHQPGRRLRYTRLPNDPSPIIGHYSAPMLGQLPTSVEFKLARIASSISDSVVCTGACGLSFPAVDPGPGRNVWTLTAHCHDIRSRGLIPFRIPKPPNSLKEIGQSPVVAVQGQEAWNDPPRSFDPEPEQLAVQIGRKLDLKTEIAGGDREFAQRAPVGDNAQFLPLECLAPSRRRALDD